MAQHTLGVEQGKARLAVVSAFDSGQIRGLHAYRADTVEQVQAVAPQHLISGVDLHRLEERVNGSAQGRHGPHGGGEILGFEGLGDLRLCGVEGSEKRALLFRLGEFHIRAEGIFDAVFFFGLCQNVVGPLEALHQVLAIVGFQEIGEGRGAVDQQGEIVISFHHQTGVDHVMTNALVAQMHLEAVVEEGEEVDHPLLHLYAIEIDQTKTREA